jgi:hypothetical protein
MTNSGKAGNAYQTFPGILVSTPQGKRASWQYYANTEVTTSSNCGCISDCYNFNPVTFNCSDNTYTVYYNNSNPALATNACVFINGTQLSGNLPSCCISQIWPSSNYCSLYSDGKSQYC